MVPQRSYGIGEMVAVPGLNNGAGTPVMGTVVAVIPGDPPQVRIEVAGIGHIEAPKSALDRANSAAEPEEKARAPRGFIEPPREGVAQ